MLRYTALTLLAVSSSFAQFIDQVTDTSDAVLINYGIADCIDAMMYINDDSMDTTTIGTGPTRTIEGIVPVPATATGTNSPIIYAATITRETTSAVTTLVISDLCTFQVACTNVGVFNFSCSYDIILPTPSYDFSDSFYGTATDMDDLATTWGISIRDFLI